MRALLLTVILYVTLQGAPLPATLAKEIYLANINASIVFTSQDGLSSGIYYFNKIDVVMRMYNLPLTYQFDPLYENTNLFMVFDLAYSDTRNNTVVQNVDPSTQSGDPILHVDNRLQTYIGGIGGGVRYRLSKHSDFSLGGEILYSRVGVAVRSSDGLSGSDIENFFKDDFNENFSYKLFAQYDYQRLYAGYQTYFRLNYKLYKTLSKLNLVDIVNDVVGDVVSLNSQTSVASLSIGAETDPLLCYNGMNLTLAPFLKANYVWGDLARVTQVNTYGIAGLSAYWNTPKKSGYISRYFIEPSWARGNGLEGYNLSFGFSLDF
ncbi:MAG: hypothetical protein MUP09_06255 [Thiovulaceae bacterium]|nr:hypothetical protein [Sulfurimonadaceae bacterium]